MSLNLLIIKKNISNFFFFKKKNKIIFEFNPDFYTFYSFSIYFKFINDFKKQPLVSTITLIVNIFLLTFYWNKARVLYYINNWVYTTNHKRIAINYFWFVILAGIVGMVLATIIRLEFAYPGVGIFAGDSIQYLTLASAHGVIMVFFMIMPLLFGAFANFLLPTQLGVHDVAFPRLNSAAFWFLPGGLLMLCQLVCVDRRYQRMNCFNIREVQSLLKRKFFNDLINSKDHHELINKTTIGTRFKTNSINSINSNVYLLNIYGLELISKIKTNLYLSNNENNETFRLITNFNKNNLFYYLINQSLSFSFFFYFNNLFCTILLNNWYFANYNYFFKNICNNFSTSTVNIENYLKSIFYKSLSIANIFTSIINFFENTINYFFSYLISFFEKKYILQIRKNMLSFVTSDNAQKYSFDWQNELYGDNFFFIKKDDEILFKFLLSFNFFKQFDDFFFFNETIQILIKTCKHLFYQINVLIALNNILEFVKNMIFFKTIFNYFFFIPIEVSSLFFNFKTFYIFNLFYTYYNSYSNSKYSFNSNDLNEKNKINIFFTSNYFNNLDQKNILISTNEESIEFSRNLKFNNPVFKYDYKSGDYFPKLYKEVYPHLFTSIINLTSGLKTSPWFFSSNTEELFENNFNNFFINVSKNFIFDNFEIHSWSLNKFNNMDGFYNFFFSLFKEHNQNINFKHISLDALNNKFQKMFLTSSLQQRIYSNWRQLKFTREAWRCKLLSARHQKTLFKRYVHEDGVFWSIERNAKDLIPGWAMITPFSSRIRFTAIGKTDIGLMGVLLVLNSSIISGANFLVTYRYLSTLNNRKTRDARAFFTEAIMVSSWMMILANPMLAIAIIMLLSDRHWQTSFFDYSGGGDTVLFQHMFWFFGHPEVYIIIIPTFGFTNTMLSYYLKKRVSARASLLYSMYTIAFLGFFVWGHHMYMVGLAHTTRMLFSTLTVMISVPAATKIMHWCVTTVNSSFMMELPLLFTFTFIFFFVSGGISGMCVAHTGMDILFHDTFYVVGHFHVMLAGAAMFASFGAFYFYFPAIFGVKYSRIYAYLHYTYYLIGQLMTVIPMFWLGYAGMPRRVLDYPASFGGWHSVISAGHMLNVAGLMAFFIMIFDSLRQNRAVIRNSFGINRFNVRLNFYIYEIAKSVFIKQKALFLYKSVKIYSIKLSNLNYFNFEPYESTLFSYVFLDPKK